MVHNKSGIYACKFDFSVCTKIFGCISLSSILISCHFVSKLSLDSYPTDNLSIKLNFHTQLGTLLTTPMPPTDLENKQIVIFNVQFGCGLKREFNGTEVY